MKLSKQDFFNQYRENTIIEVVQELSKSEAGSQIAFKGGTALKLFYGLPRYSEDIDYDIIQGAKVGDLHEAILSSLRKKRWEITDDAVKHYTILVELRFAGPERNFHIKIEISTREKPLKTTVASLRGVPVLTLEQSFLMTEKLVTFIERCAGRDVFDAWFILNNAYPLNKVMIEEKFGSEKKFYAEILERLEKGDSKRLLRDTGKLLSEDHRTWIKTSFLEEFQELVRTRMRTVT
jgi:predicted nucleotidyltransferase component of viral defense system